MKLLLTVLFSTVGSVVIMGYMKSRMKEPDELKKRLRFDDIKLRVTNDLFEDYVSEKEEAQGELDGKMIKLTGLRKAMDQMKGASEMTEELDTCDGHRKTKLDQLAVAQNTFSHIKDECHKDKGSWEVEQGNLKGTLQKESALCKFLKAGAKIDQKLCKDVPKVEEPKAVEPKAVEPEANAPKEEQPKAEEPKP